LVEASSARRSLPLTTHAAKVQVDGQVEAEFHPEELVEASSEQNRRL
jgi:hypothetical protein